MKQTSWSSLATLLLVLGSGGGCVPDDTENEERTLATAQKELTSSSFVNQLVALNPGENSQGIADLGWDDEALLIEPSVSASADSAARYQSRALVMKTMAYMARHAPEVFGVQEVGRSVEGQPIRALHVHNPALTVENAASVPALLIECSMHAPEWLASESCARFLQRLFAAYRADPAGMAEFFAESQLYVVPVVNPDGRDHDAEDSGEDIWNDPTEYRAWRKNRQAIHCTPDPDSVGIDLARNFSNGWSQPVAEPPSPTREQDCTDSKYHGNFPFQAPEAAAMRRFVNNRTVAVSVSVHSNGSGFQTTNNTAERDQMRDGFVSWWNDVLLNDLSPVDSRYVELNSALSSMPGGTGLGQFSGWMSRASNAVLPSGIDELDHGTHRGVSAFMLELPPVPADALAYNGSPYQDQVGDGSNTQHPSAAAILREVPVAASAAFAYMVRQARSPYCTIDPGSFESNSCPEVALTGSKLARETDGVGVLDFALRRTQTYETAPVGSFGAVYRVENYNPSAANLGVNVSIMSRPIDGSWGAPQQITTTHSLAAGESGVGTAEATAVTFSSMRDYQISLTLVTNGAPDTDTNNNSNLHRFRVEPPALLATESVWLSDRSLVLGGARGNQYVEIGADAELTGALESSGQAFLRERATVGGSAVTGGALTRQNQVKVWGQTLENQSVPIVSLETHAVATNGDHRNLCNQALPPGVYGNVVVESQCSVTLSTGTYEVGRFTVRPDAELFVSGKVDVRTQSELSLGDRSFVSGVGDPEDFAVYSNQPYQLRIPVAARFTGFVTAPYAEVNVASRSWVKGAIRARNIRVEPDSQIVGAWEPLGRERGYTLHLDDAASVIDPTMGYVEAREHCQTSKDDLYPAQNVECSFDGRAIGYELFWNGQRVGFEPYWTISRSKANCEWNRTQYPNRHVECYYDGERLGYERFTGGFRVAFQPIWSVQQGLNDCRANPVTNSLCVYDGAALGYELVRNGNRSVYEPEFGLQQARDACQASKDAFYPTENVECFFAGEPVGFELFWNGNRVGFEPKWSRSRGRSNCEWNRAEYPHRTVDCSYAGQSLWFN